MPQAKQKGRKGARTRAKKAPLKNNNGSPKDAIALLKADHRQVEQWFGEFEKARDETRKTTLAKQICDSLKVHTQIEEGIFIQPFSKRLATRTCITRPRSSIPAPSV